MTQFEEWFDAASWVNEHTLAESAYLAGQASAEQYGPEDLYTENDQLKLRVVELERERDEYANALRLRMMQITDLKAQVGEPCSVCKGRGVVTVLHHTRDRTEIPCSACTHPTTEPVRAQAGEPVMPSYGQIPWKDLVDAIGEAQGVPWSQDDSYYIGHQPVRINMNSLNRIVSKFVAITPLYTHPTTERRVMEQALDALESLYKSVEGDYWNTSYSVAMQELRNALNAAPAKEMK